MFKPLWRAVSALALMGAVAACGGDGGSGPPGSIGVTASPTALTVQQGGSGTVTVTLTRGGGFADAVNVTVEGLPSGVTASVSPAQLTGTTTSAIVTVNVANTVTAGTYTATIRASATGVGAATVQYALTVTAAPNYTLTATPPALSVGQGSSGTTSIGINRTNFTDAVALSLVNPPAGITGTFNPASATGTTSQLTVNVAGSVATGSYTLTVQGAATGPGNKTTTVALTVTPPPDYTLSTTPATLTLAAGTNATTTVNINRTNFTGAVTLSLDNPPQGITATFNPAAPTGTSSVATINVATTVAPGNYTVTIRGVAASARIDGVDEAAAIADPRTTTVALTVTTAASFSLSASPNALTIAPGASGTSTVTLVRTNFATDVALSVPTQPSGITGSFAPATLSGGTLGSTVTITVPGTTPAGTYPVTIQGVGGSLTQTTTVTVTVPAPNVTFSATPSSLSIQQGGTGTTTLNVARTAFTTNITPAVTGNPAGMTVSFNPNPVTGTSSTVTVTVGSSVTPNTYNVVIAATGVPGNPSVTLPVTVTAPGGGNIVWEFCTSDAPTKFWRKSAGTWAEVTGSVVGSATRFAFSASGNDAGVAFTTVSGNAVTTTVMLMTSSELSAGANTCIVVPADVSKTFNVTGMGGAEVGQLGYGPSFTALAPGTPSYMVQVPSGSYDWMAAFGTSMGFPVPTTTYTNYRIGRNEAAPGAAVNIDRNGATAFVTTPFTITGAAGGSFNQFIQGFASARGSMGSLLLGSPLGTSTSGNLLFPASADRLSSDMHTFSVNNTEGIGTSVINSRLLLQYLGSGPPASANFTLPAMVPTFTVSQPGGMWQAAGSIAAEYQTATSPVSATFQGSSGTTVYFISATRNWLVSAGMATNFTLAQQNLPGFLPAWTPDAPLSSASVSQTASDLTTSTPVAGQTVKTGIRTLTPP